MRLKLKIALLFAVLAGTLVLLSGAAVYWLSARDTAAAFSRRLELRAVVAAKAALERDESGSVAYDEVMREHASRLPLEHEYILPVDVARRPAARPAGLPAALVADILRNGAATAKGQGIFYAGVLYEDNQGTFVVVVSARNQYAMEHLADLRRVLLLSTLVSFVLASLMGFLFAERLLRPLRAVTRRASAISAENLHLRLEDPGTRDELSALTAAFNVMLDRLEAAFATQASFVGHASHELNTPLTAIIGEAEYALTRPRSREQYSASLETIRTEAGRLHDITRALLQLARTSRDQQVFEAIPLVELLGDVQATVAHLEPATQVLLDTEAGFGVAVVQGNRPLLEQALANVVLNGSKYSNRAPVRVALSREKGFAVIVVTDTGIGIPPGELPHVFDPFFRASNSLSYAGYGIGLPLVHTILRIHGGRIAIRSEEGQGTTVRMVLPLAQR